MKILTVIGARPQFIKIALLSKELKKNFDEVIVHTGQHYDYEMSKVFFEQLDIPKPDYNLDIRKEDEVEQITSMMLGLEKVMLHENPDLIMLIGDTNSTLAAALTASRLKIKCAHVESGTRMFDKKIPEEMNRIVADYISDMLFCPSLTAVENLKSEGIKRGVFFTGDVMIDALMNYTPLAKKSKILEKLGLEPKKYILATVHRQSNTNDKKKLSEIFSAFGKSGKKIAMPLHPRTRKYLDRYGLLGTFSKRILITEPANYIDMLALQMNAKKIVTDSGGIQKEAYYLKVPCITLGNSTGWPETVSDGWNLLTGHDGEKIKKAINNFKPNSKQKKHYGNGNAIKKIVNLLREVK